MKVRAMTTATIPAMSMSAPIRMIVVASGPVNGSAGPSGVVVPGNPGSPSLSFPVPAVCVPVWDGVADGVPGDVPGDGVVDGLLGPGTGLVDGGGHGSLGSVPPGPHSSGFTVTHGNDTKRA
jgi:hypothetical protein